MEQLGAVVEAVKSFFVGAGVPRGLGLARAAAPSLPSLPVPTTAATPAPLSEAVEALPPRAPRGRLDLAVLVPSVCHTDDRGSLTVLQPTQYPRCDGGAAATGDDARAACTSTPARGALPLVGLVHVTLWDGRGGKRCWRLEPGGAGLYIGPMLWLEFASQ